MIKKIKTKNMHRRNFPVAILTVKKIYNKEESQRFIKSWEEATKFGSKIKTVMLNDEVIEFKGFLRKQPRIVNIPKAVRKSVKVFQALEQTGFKSKEDLIQYIYDFAWNYGRYYHLPSSRLIIEKVKEHIQLPEEAIK
jgi:hypothetical protein